ncbi:CLK4-associating serine/arginine rich protein-like [Antedon mediterranea]|uniref:CLK4-associating serine/arginine rich protein-like n=1 Tax=Antedon mediterranea TaxID=105859 RepID=UPI003AF9BC8D
MWHEARKQEKKIRGMMVDFKKRAERRREYYETIKLDPAQFLQIHGRACKIHLDPAVYHAAESPATMMPWQGQKTNMIDRFDVRAHLDIIPEYSGIGHLLLPPEVEKEERKCNYERFRVLVQNDYKGNSEEQCLQQIYIDEMFPELQNKHEADKSKKLLTTKKAAIGFSYEDSTGGNAVEEANDTDDDDDDTDDSLSDLEIDNVNLDIDELNPEQVVLVNQVGEKYGLAAKQFTQLLQKEKEEAENLKKAKAEEEERAMYSGRKSRRERRAYIEKRLREKKVPSPPSYARRDSPTYDPYPSHGRRSSSGSRSSTPEDSGKVTFITSFGGEEDAAKIEEKNKSNSDTHSKVWKHSQRSSSSSSSSSSPRRDKRRKSQSFSRSSSRSSSRSRSHSRSRSPKRVGKYFQHRHRASSSSSSEHNRPQGKRFFDRARALPPVHNRHSRSRSRDRSATGQRRRSSSSDSASSRSRSRSLEPVTPTQVMKLKKETPKPKLPPGSADKKPLTAKDRMKMMMQRALNKQHKTDKKKEVLKKEEKLQAQISREDDLRERARQMRRVERERRDREWDDDHGHSRRDSDDSYERRRRRRESRNSPARRRSRSRTRSRSHSPRSHHHRHHHRDYR